LRLSCEDHLSYSFQVEAKDNKLSVVSQTAEVPDGKYTVNGHDSETDRNLGAVRFDGSGNVVVQANAFARRV
jgi:hypothetical protein